MVPAPAAVRETAPSRVAMASWAEAADEGDSEGEEEDDGDNDALASKMAAMAVSAVLAANVEGEEGAVEESTGES